MAVLLRHMKFDRRMADGFQEWCDSPRDSQFHTRDFFYEALVDLTDKNRRLSFFHVADVSDKNIKRIAAALAVGDGGTRPETFKLTAQNPLVFRYAAVPLVENLGFKVVAEEAKLQDAVANVAHVVLTQVTGPRVIALLHLLCQEEPIVITQDVLVAAIEYGLSAGVLKKVHREFKELLWDRKRHLSQQIAAAVQRGDIEDESTATSG